jgi:uncharacterized protein (TIGR00730 family)
MKQNINHTPLESLNEDQLAYIKSIATEYEIGYKTLNALSKNSVTFYGGARVLKNTQTYNLVKEIATELARKNFSIVTGGGPGVMEAALIGARDGKSTGIGFGINIDQEQLSGVADKCILFENFSVRKYMLRQSDVHIYCPGGVGTLDELMENITLMKTNKLPSRPIFLLDSFFWKPYLNWLTEIKNQNHYIPDSVLFSFNLVDTASEIITSLGL